MAYAVYTFASQYTDTGLIGFYVGTRAENLADCLEIASEQITEVAEGRFRKGELDRAKENLKGRILLSMESTSNRMSRLGKSLISDTELLSIDRIAAEIDAVTPDAVAELAGVLLAPEKLSAAGIGPGEERFREAVRRVKPDARPHERSGVKVALLGHEGKVGAGAEARARGGRPRGQGDRPRRPGRGRGLDAAVHFTRRTSAFGTVTRRLEQGVPSIVGTSGLEQKELDDLGGYAQEQGVQLFVAPNFAVGAVLMMRFAAEAATATCHAPRSSSCTTRRRSTRPSGTAKATAEALGGAPIHSVRLPGLVAHQEVLLGAARRAADDPPRRLLARGLRSRRPARARTALQPATRPHGRPREPARRVAGGKIAPCSARS